LAMAFFFSLSPKGRARNSRAAKKMRPPPIETAAPTLE
jgi:hypothetical protein